MRVSEGLVLKWLNPGFPTLRRTDFVTILLTLWSVYVCVTARDARICVADDFKYGQWIKGASKCGLKVEFSSTQLSVRKGSKYVPNRSEWSDYCWTPLDCIAEPFEISKFCKWLNGRNILFVGDSLLFQIYEALWLQAGAKLDGITKGRGQFCGDYTKGLVLFVRNDQLSVSNENSPFSYAFNGTVVMDQYIMAEHSNLKWKHFIANSHVLVLNKGHHVEHFRHLYDENGLPLHGSNEEDVFNMHTKKTVHYLKKAAKGKAVFFITTTFGHPYCNRNSTISLEQISKENEYSGSDPISKIVSTYERLHRRSVYIRNYSWHTYKRHDDFTIDLMKRELNAVIVDIRPMSLLRSDGHVAQASDAQYFADPESGDCLHYTAPGVPDNWMKVLFNLLSASNQSMKQDAYTPLLLSRDELPSHSRHHNHRGIN